MLCLFGIQLQAQQMTYHDASCFPLLGKATQDTGARYERLPDSLKNISRPPLWNLSRNSAGMAIRFRPGVKIGHRCIIGAGSVVTKDIPDNSVAVGNPAKVIRKVD